MWHRGPSLSWTSTLVDGHFTFRNMITHQVKWVTPDALAWRLVKGPAGGPSFWFNFRTNGTSMVQPAELTDEMAAEAKELSKHYWVNEVTGVFKCPLTGALAAHAVRGLQRPLATVWSFLFAL
jgi:hypothetical protein